MCNKRYENPYKKRIKRSLLDYLFWFLGFYGKIRLPIPPGFNYPNQKEKKQSDSQLTWLNHSTFLIEIKGVRFLTDPVFNNRCSPCSFIGPKRHHPPGLKREELPSIDFVLISHNHYDHMERSTLYFLQEKNPQIQWIVPLGLGQWFKKRMPKARVIELDWHQSYCCPDKKMRCTAVPAQHFSGRGLFDTNRSLWMGVVVEIGEKCFYFAGDTGYNEIDFKALGRKYRKIDLSLLPIGAYMPRGFMQAVHINPEEAVMIHEEIGSSLSVAGHWRTFTLSEEGLFRPPYDLYCALRKRSISCDQFRVLEPGQKISW